MSKQRTIGTKAETAVVRIAQASGFPYACRRTLKGSADEGDVQLDSRGRVIVEVKAGKAAEQASDSQVAKWLEETERERVNAGAERAFLVLKRAGKGDRNAGQWWAISGLSTATAFYYFASATTSCGANERPIVRMTLEDMLRIAKDVFGEEVEA